MPLHNAGVAICPGGGGRRRRRAENSRELSSRENRVGTQELLKQDPDNLTCGHLFACSPDQSHFGRGLVPCSTRNYGWNRALEWGWEI